MKVLLASSSPPDRGAGINGYLAEIAGALRDLGHELYLATPHPGGQSWATPLVSGTYWTDPSADPQLAVRSVLGFVRDREIEGVINNDNPVVQSLFPALRCPAISVGHLGRTSVASLACYNWQWADHVVCISNEMRDTFVSRHGVPVIKCPVVYNGVQDRGGDLSTETDQDAPLRLVFCGGYSERKGSDLLLRCLLEEPNAWVGTRLDWFGAVPERIRRKLRDRMDVHFRGRVSRDEVLSAMRGAHLLLLPSREEGCPMVMLEAMSLGLAPIVSDGVGAMDCVVTSGREGYVCRLKDWTSDLSACLVALRDDRQRLQVMRRAARRRYLEAFQGRHTAERLVELLHQPTVDRSTPQEAVEVLRWHRPLRAGGDKAPLYDRFCIRLGILRKAGVVRFA